MRYVFMDEAGTSSLEPVTVIAALIADADSHIMPAEALFKECIGAVPKELQEKFVFHATDIFSGKLYKEAEWALTDRLNLLYSVMSIPRKLGLAVALSLQWRGAVDFTESYGKWGLNPAQSDHFHAFMFCVAMADKGIRKYARPNEVGTIVAEDVPEMRKFIKRLPELIRNNPQYLPQSFRREAVSDAEAGYSLQSGDIRVTRIRNAVHFVEKDADPIVQIADACAYGIRRYFAGEKFGLEFARAIMGSEHSLRNFASPGGFELYWPGGPPAQAGLASSQPQYITIPKSVF